MKNIAIISIVIITIFLSSCSDHKEADGHDHGAESSTSEEHHDEHENPSTTTLTDAQMKSIKIEFGNIEKKQLTASLKANGILKVPNQNRATVNTLMGGVIKSILISTGNIVSKGQVIATIVNTSFITMQEEYLSVSAKAALSELEVSRQKELQVGNAGVLKNLQSVESELKILKARKMSLQKQLELVGINAASLTSDNIQSTVNITSPINGVVSSLMVNIGSFVDANNSVAEIVQHWSQ